MKRIQTAEVLTDYRDLIKQYLIGELPHAEFADVYMRRFQREDRDYGDALFPILQELWEATECFTEEDADEVAAATGIDRIFYVDLKELRTTAEDTLNKLNEFEKSLSD